jgi:hypothetical protein
MANALLVSRPRRASNQAMAVQRHSLRAQQAPQAYLTILNSYGGPHGRNPIHRYTVSAGRSGLWMLSDLASALAQAHCSRMRDFRNIDRYRPVRFDRDLLAVISHERNGMIPKNSRWWVKKLYRQYFATKPGSNGFTLWLVVTYAAVVALIFYGIWLAAQR